MRAWDFEETVMEKEGLRLIIRAPWNAQVADYGTVRRANDNMSLKRFLEVRVRGKVNPFEVEALDGRGQKVHGRMLLRNVRASYRE